MPYAAEQDARDAYAGLQAGGARLKAVMDAAAGMVARIAPPPDPMDAAYPGLAASAEILAGDWLWHTGGYITRDSVLDKWQTFADSESVEVAIAGVMGPYAPSNEKPPSFAGAVPSAGGLPGPEGPHFAAGMHDHR